MSLNKAIKSGKEKRKAYRGAKAVDWQCRNHGSCPHCQQNRIHRNTKRLASADEQLQDLKIAEEALAEYIAGGRKSRPIDELWKELDL